jgi:hypothetical protein
MGNAVDLAKIEPVRELIVGYPGTAKTGGLACLANAGFKLRILDFDGNLTPLLRFTRPECLHNIDILSFEDKLRSGAQYTEVVGLPTAFQGAFKALDRWKYKNPDGSETDLGCSKDWGLDTIVVLDSLTAMGNAAMRRAMAVMNKTPLNTTDGVWGLAMREQEAFIERLTSQENKHHVIVTAHLKMIGPKDIRKGDTDLTKTLKQEAASLVDTRLFPSALGQALPPVIGGHFPTLVEAKSKVQVGGKVKRVICTVPQAELDLKVPAPNIPAEMPVEDAQITIFNALTGGIERCLEHGAPVSPPEAASN